MTLIGGMNQRLWPPALLNHRDIGDRDEFELTSTFVEHQRASILSHKAMFCLFDPNHVAVVESQRVWLKRPAIINVQQRFSRHARIVHHPLRFVNLPSRPFTLPSSGTAAAAFSSASPARPMSPAACNAPPA
jgi:hypothetical protein